MKYSVRYTLNRPHTDGTKAIRMRVSWNGQCVTHYLDTSAKDSEWDSRTGLPLRTHRRAMKEIQEKTAAIDRLFDAAHLEHRIVTPAEVKSALGDIHTKEQAKESLLLVGVMDLFLKDSTLGDGWSYNTRRNYITLRNRISDWRPYQTLADFTKADIQAFMDFCFERGLINATVQKFLKQLRWTLRTAIERGLCEQTDATGFYTRYRSESENEVVYLTRDELHRIMELDLSALPHLDRVRDIFLFCCFSGLRYSDVAKLRRSDIHKEHFRVVTKKTSAAINIELNKVTAAILEKYNCGNDADCPALPVVSNQKTNIYLKELGRMAKIDEPVRRVWWVRSERHEESVPKWQVFTSHCGRKTFVVTALSLDIASEVVMRWTGHKDHKTLKPYIAIADDVKKKKMSMFDTFADSVSEM